MEDRSLEEAAKAAQEAAKVAGKALEFTERNLAGFFGKVIGAPITELAGMWTDHLRVVRYERLARLQVRVEQFWTEIRANGKFLPAPPKIALPVIEAASLEENDELQDLWAYLLASATSENSQDRVRSAFVQMIKQLEIEDVKILNYCYQQYRIDYHFNSEYSKRKYHSAPRQHPIKRKNIEKATNVSFESYDESVENLRRLRLIEACATHVEVENEITHETYHATFDHGNNKLVLTELGVSFILVCTGSGNSDCEKEFREAGQKKYLEKQQQLRERVLEQKRRESPP